MDLRYTEEDYRGVQLSFRVRDVLFQGKSEFQEVSVVETEEYGRLLALDNCVMISDGDEFVYHELITHPVVAMHRDPRKILIIGGGDGGTARELLRHNGIEEITVCEIDGMVVDVCKEFFPKVAVGFDSPRVRLKIDDGIAFVKNHPEHSFDIVIVDSTDPIGPGEGLFTVEFYQQVKRILKEDGLVVCQSESPWFPQEDLRKIRRNLTENFSCVKTYVGSIPTYPRGLWSWTVAGREGALNQPVRSEVLESIQSELCYLNVDMLASIFALPNFIRKKFGLQ